MICNKTVQSRQKKPKPFKDGSTRLSREEQGPMIPKDFDSWSEDRKASWKRLPDDPDQYYYRFLDPDVVETSTAWTNLDRDQFFQVCGLDLFL